MLSFQNNTGDSNDHDNLPVRTALFTSFTQDYLDTLIMKLFIGQLHTPGSLDRDDFDYLVTKTSEADVISTVKLDMVQRLVDGGPEDDDELNSLKALLNVNSKDDMIAWFENHYNYFSFNIHLVTVND